MVRNKKVSILVILAAMVAVSGGYLLTSKTLNFEKSKNSFAATGQDISSRVTATAEARPTNGVGASNETWYSKVDVTVSGRVNAGDYIDIAYKNIAPPFASSSLNIDFNGTNVGSATILPGGTSGYQWWVSNDWKNRIDEMNTSLKDGYGDNKTVRVTFNQNVEQFENVKFSITASNGLNVHLISKNPYTMISSISIGGNELVRLSNTVPALVRQNERHQPTGFTGSKWLEARYENGKYTDVKAAIWAFISEDRGILAGDTFEISLDENSPLRFGQNAKMLFDVSANVTHFDKKYNANDIFYTLPVDPIEGMTSVVSSDGKTLKVTFAKNYTVSPEKAGLNPFNINGLIIINRSPEFFDMENKRVNNVAFNAVWKSANGAEVSNKVTTNPAGSIRVAGTDASGQYRPKSNISVKPYSGKISVDGYVCDDGTFEKFVIRENVEATSRFEIKPEEIFAKLPAGYEILNPEVLSGEMGYQDIDIEIKACKKQEKVAEKKVEEPKINAPNTGFSKNNDFGLILSLLAINSLLSVVILKKYR